MNCKEIQTVTKFGGARSPISATGVEEHIKDCVSCKNLLLSEKLAPAIFKAASNHSHDAARIISHATLISGIRRRIQEIRDQRSSSWETAVETMSRWLAAFAVTAIVLVAASIQWRPSVMTTDFDLITQNADEHLISDDPSPAGAGKDNPYVDK
jgi:predicted anti-sigma-YlaC factor YlaD